MEDLWVSAERARRQNGKRRDERDDKRAQQTGSGHVSLLPRNERGAAEKDKRH
jgi:hypothetical protein